MPSPLSLFASASSLALLATALAGPAWAHAPSRPLAHAAQGAPVPGQEAQPTSLPVPPPPPYAVDVPEAKTLYRYGPDGRYLLAGSWLFRYDRGQGLAHHYQSSSSRSGWKTVSVPNVWNAQDESTHSYTGTVAWYRKDFRLPDSSSAITWLVRFESVNYKARAWLNGHPIGTHKGAYLPFEFELPSHDLSRTGTNRLVLRVDNRRGPGDLPPGGVSERGTLAGGWWNYGGLPREVYLRKVTTIDFEHVQVLTDLPTPTGAGKVTYRVTARNYSHSTQSVHLASTFGSQAVDLGTVSIGAGSSQTVAQTITVPNPKLWTPDQPNLYDVNLTAAIGSQQVAHYFLRSGIRSISVVGGHLYLNGRLLNFRGVALHEDSPALGSAIPNSTRDQYIGWVKDLGATLIRAHYPLSQYLEEQADANGILLWSEVPVYSVREDQLRKSALRHRAVDFLRNNILTNSSHPSVAIWSVGNELSSRPGTGQRAYLVEAVSEAHALDPTRPVGMAILGYPSVNCQASAYTPLQVIGINDYFGWYAGPSGSIADRDLLGDYLDQMHACYPTKGLVVTEFGAEANRPGPAEENGTYAFQQAFVNFTLGLIDTKPYISGAIYFALQEFRVRPGWAGGDPRPDPPIHEKGLVSFTGALKPAYFDVKRIYHATTQLAPG